MRIEHIDLRNFRNYAAQSIDFHPECNVICGDNAQGKTNLLEAVACLSHGKSPRTRADQELITFDAPDASILAHAFARQRDFHISIALSRAKRRSQTINGVRTPPSGLSQTLQTVFFQPDDLSLIRAGAAARRRFMDTALCQLRPAYAHALTAYTRALAQKTRILRDCADFPRLLDTLPDFNAQLLTHGARLILYRLRFTESLNHYAAEQHQACSGGRETLTVRYKTISTLTAPSDSSLPLDTHINPSDKSTDPSDCPSQPRCAHSDPSNVSKHPLDIKAVTDALKRHMDAHAAAERASGQCLSGPHRDDLIVEINGRDAKIWSSQGQTRTAALALKLAEREIYSHAAGEYPILLLDDVLSELDPVRQEFVLNRVRNGQIFITCCEEDRLTRLLGGKILRVHAGTLSE